jgi:hypothetical protein
MREVDRLADIGVPPEAYARPSVDARVCAVFHTDDVVRLW